MSAETRTFATFGSDPSIAGSLRAGVGLGGLAIKGSVSPSYSEGLLGLGCGYGLYLTAPGAPFSFSDEFSRDAGLLRYARSISLSAAANALGLAFKASAASQEESLRFSQNWNAELGLSAWLSLKASAGLKLAESLLNTEDIGSSWLRSWELFLPAREADARVRTISLESSILDKSMSASLLREFIVSGREPALEATSRQSSQRIAAALSVPFELGFLKVKPN